LALSNLLQVHFIDPIISLEHGVLCFVKLRILLLLGVGKIKNPTIFPQNEKINSCGLCVSESFSVHVYVSLMFLPLKWHHQHYELFSHVLLEIGPNRLTLML
jgi:hypothetical protein